MQFVSVTSQVSFLSTSFHKKVKKYKEKPHLSKGKESTYLFGQYRSKKRITNRCREKEVLFLFLFSVQPIHVISGVCKTRTGYLRMEDADGGCGWKNADSADSKRRMEKMLINQKTKNKTRKCR